MPSDFLTPFLELDEEFCKSFRGLEASEAPPPDSLQHQRVLGFQRRHSLCPVSLPNSKFNSEGAEPCGWSLGATPAAATAQWSRELPRSALSHIPFRVDRSVSMIEGHAPAAKDDKREASPTLLPPPPGLCISSSALSAAAAAATPPSPSPHLSTRYKTELCRTFEESGACKYGAKCQFAHGLDELRGLSRHPKYKTEPCRTFHTIGFCPYGARCHFIHNADEVLNAGGGGGGGLRPRAKAPPPPLRHSLSFAGFSSARLFQAADDSSPPSLLFGRASSVSPPPSSSSAGSPELLSPLFPEPGALRHCPNPFSGTGDPAGAEDSALRFYAVGDPAPPHFAAKKPSLQFHLPPPPAPPTLSGFSGLQRCSSADSLSEEGYTSSCSLSSASSGAESPSFEGRRLPIFSRLSVSDE